MDEVRFDRLTRTIAAGRTRRAALRGLAGAVAAIGPLARARADAQTTVPIGGACTSDSQCFASAPGLICADNGIANDGTRNCCALDGGRCQFDGHCCGVSGCFDGVCGYYGPMPTGGAPLGASCSSTGDCAGGGDGVICTGSFTAQGTFCCLTNGQSCGADSECCFTDRCLNQGGVNRCVQYYGGQCLNDEGCYGDLVCFNNYCT